MERSIAIRLKGDKEISFCNTEEFQRIFHVKYLPTLQFQPVTLHEKAMKNIPWLLRYTPLGQEHRELGILYREQLIAGQVANVAIEWIDDEIGYGLFARVDLPPQSFVGEYTGIVRQIMRLYPDLNGYCIHYPTKFFSYNYLLIDAQRAGNEMRFVNHSDDPNLKPMCIIDSGLQHIVFFTTKPVACGQQLTFNYGSDYWRNRFKIDFT